MDKGQPECHSFDIQHMKQYSMRFVEDRDWGKFQTPKNIAIGIVRESSELLEIFQWLSDSESQDIKNDLERLNQIKHELGDILHYVVRLSNLLNVDLAKAFWEKMELNESKYPVDQCRGKREKYTQILDKA